MAPSFVEIHMKMTKLCCFDQDSPPPFLSVRASCRTKWTVLSSLRRMSGLQTLQIWISCIITPGTPCWKSTVNFSRSLRWLMGEVALQTIWEELPQEHINKTIAINFTKCLLPTLLLLPWSYRASVVTIPSPSLHPHLHQQTDFFTNTKTGEDNAEKYLN